MPLGLLVHVPFLGRIVVGAIAFIAGPRNGDPVPPASSGASEQTLDRRSQHSHSRRAAYSAGREIQMYVGGSLALLGSRSVSPSIGSLLLVVVSRPLVHYRIILREERYLERKFGNEYRRYKTKIPRYWWRF
jgi:hypothetical protein